MEDTVPLIAAQSDQIRDDKRSSGFDIPSDYFDQWMAEIYCPEHLPALMQEFGCPNLPNGTIVDCKDKLDRYLTSSIFACNSRFAFNGAGLRQVISALLTPRLSDGTHESHLVFHNVTNLE